MHIRILSPAGNIKPKLVDRGSDTLRSWGHIVSVSTHAKGTYGRFSGTPDERASDLREALEDPAVDMIWATRGGYGCMQLLDLLPLSLIREAQKPLVGYSDITALHALWQHAGVPSLHAPMMKHLAEQPTHPTTRTLRELIDYYATHHTWPPRHNWLFMQKAKLFIAPSQGWLADDPTPDDTAAWLAEWRQQPLPMVGGNLAVFSALHGTPYDFLYQDHVLFLEDIAESPYKIDRMLQQLRYTGILQQVRGVVCGHFTGCDEDPLMPVKLWDNIRGLLAPYHLPLWLGAPIGHEVDNYPVVLS